MGKRWASAGSGVHLAEAGYAVSPVAEGEREQSWRRRGCVRKAMASAG